ncbi:hypothetical protein OS493_022819 [Desmophyllum pertusum]|uniref:RxLR effector protein n=1 Tax=Desmophyllum pertusum TaxID=174260 RepID=A0A9W9ZZI5_9CNID|nr:hypothetical protein OS493_022819 [Desmophyllum pertusum]
MLFSSSMLWLQRRLAVLILALNCLVHCAVPNTARRNEKLPTTPSHSDSRTDHEIKLPKTAGSKPTTRPTTKKSTTKKTEAPELVNEFSLNEILFKGRQSNEANAFLKANEQRGKVLETTYEHIREQDLNDIEAFVKRRNQMRLSRL